jgi:hypothetical protein
MTTTFEPNNLLEEKLLAMYRKEIRNTEFLNIMLDSQLIILADRDVDISVPDTHFKPLAIPSPMGYNALATFSSIERAQAVSSRYPGYGHAITVDTCWFLLRADENVGFAFNPGWRYGFELSPDGLQQFLIQFGVKRLVMPD